MISSKHDKLSKEVAHRIVRSLTVEYNADAKPADYQMTEEVASTPRIYDSWLLDRDRSRSPAPQR